MKLCKRCKENPVEIKSRNLCNKCYMYLYWRNLLDKIPTKKDYETMNFNAEVEFAKNYFNSPDEYIRQPATFNLKITSYRPDYYDIKRNIWIEVVGSREAFRQNKKKYSLFKYMYPELKFELRAPGGELIEEAIHGKNMKWPESIKQIQIRRRQNGTKRVMGVSK